MRTKEEKNYQKSNISIKKCKNCTDECEKLQDHHHDQTYSMTCGTVIYESGEYQIDYYTDPLYWEKEYQYRNELKQLKKILEKLKEWETPYEIIEENRKVEITIPELTLKQQKTIINISSDTVWKIILEKKYTKQGTYTGSQFKVKKKTVSEIEAEKENKKDNKNTKKNKQKRKKRKKKYTKKKNKMEE